MRTFDGCEVSEVCKCDSWMARCIAVIVGSLHCQGFWILRLILQGNSAVNFGYLGSDRWIRQCRDRASKWCGARLCFWSYQRMMTWIWSWLKKNKPGLFPYFYSFFQMALTLSPSTRFRSWRVASHGIQAEGSTELSRSCPFSASVGPASLFWCRLQMQRLGPWSFEVCIDRHWIQNQD